MEWFSWLIAFILGLSAILSPIATTIINNYYQMKLSKLNMYDEAKRKALCDFVDCAQDYLLNLNYVEQSVNYYSSLNRLFIYFNDIDLATFIPFENACQQSNNQKVAIFELSKVVQALSKQIPKR